jgi:hypothetical protein
MSHKDLAYILNLKHPHRYWFCTPRYTLSGAYIRINVSVYWFLYILTFIPAIIVTLLACLWDGGIRAFYIPERLYSTWNFCIGSEPYRKAVEILDTENEIKL